MGPRLPALDQKSFPPIPMIGQPVHLDDHLQGIGGFGKPVLDFAFTRSEGKSVELHNVATWSLKCHMKKDYIKNKAAPATPAVPISSSSSTITSSTSSSTSKGADGAVHVTGIRLEDFDISGQDKYQQFEVQ